MRAGLEPIRLPLRDGGCLSAARGRLSLSVTGAGATVENRSMTSRHRARQALLQPSMVGVQTGQRGRTLHQLRHSSLTHLGEAGVSAILLQAKSRHQDPRTLARYAKPGIEAVAALTAEFDRGRRHRQ